MESNHRFLDVTQVSSPLDHGTVFIVDSLGVAPRLPACGAGVFLLDDEPVLSPKVHASELPARHAPKDLNPDQLGWNQSCYRYTRDTHLNISGSRGTRTHNGNAAACFQNRFLIQPDDFRLKAAGAGIEPTSRRSERPVLPLNDPAVVICL